MPIKNGGETTSNGRSKSRGTRVQRKKRRASSLDIDPHRWIGGVMSGAGTEGKKPRLAEHEAEHIVLIMEMVRV